MERPDLLTDERFVEFRTRTANQDELVAIIEAWLNTFPNIDAAIARLDEFDVPNCRINNTDDVTSQDTYITRGPNALFSETPGYIHKAPTLGQNSKEIFEELGYSAEEIDSMLSDWAPKR